MAAIPRALSKASKQGKGGGGYPEYIITAPATPDKAVDGGEAIASAARSFGVSRQTVYRALERTPS